MLDDPRANARIDRRALDEVKAIQTLLADVYKDTGDGRTLLRELVQNADDARATRLVFAVLDRGWPRAANSLLRGPALVVVNDGAFPARDRDALHRALGGSKADDAGTVGRFGLGLKSVFHICEALVYVGTDGVSRRPGALNPWAGTDAEGDRDPRHPDWDSVSGEDLENLVAIAEQLLGAFGNGLLLWIPLRRHAHLDRTQVEEEPYGLGQVCPTPEEVAGWFVRSGSLVLLLAQCGYLYSIEARRVSAPEALDTPAQLARVARHDFAPPGWVARHADDRVEELARAFAGRIDDGARAWSVVGVEALGLASLRALRAALDWPRDLDVRDGRTVRVSRKALAHAAVTVLRPDGSALKYCGVRFRWAVFLPLNDDPDAASSAIVEAVGHTPGSEVWEIILHGYFWPSHDRRSIPGVTDDDIGTGDNAVRTRWNRELRDELLLPLLPGALANAVAGIPEEAVRPMLIAVLTARTIQDHLGAVTRRHALLPVIVVGGVCWTVQEIAEADVLSIPAWTRAPAAVGRSFAVRQHEYADGAIFIDDDAPRLGGRVVAWSSDWLARLLDCLPVEATRTPLDLGWIAALLRHVIQDDGHDERSAVAARWLATRIAEGAFTSSTEAAKQEELRTAWRALVSVLPAAWLVHAPVASLSAVVELAAEGIVGPGLLPIPFGRRPADDSGREPACLDRALLELGQRLSKNDGASQRVLRSRLILAETLLSMRDQARPLGDVLGGLPLLRALRLPEGTDDAWSVRQLERELLRHRVFSRASADDGGDSAALESPSDPRRAVTDLAEAVGDSAWLVEAGVGAMAGAPIPTVVELAVAVLAADSLQDEPSRRGGLLKRLASDAMDPTVCRALRAVLTGRVSASAANQDLFYVRRGDSEKVANLGTLRILLGLLGRPWCAVEPDLVAHLPRSLPESLSIKEVDHGILHRLLDECLCRPVDWTHLEHLDVLHLLQHLYGTEPAEHVRWRSMPLHRTASGGRGPLHDRARRVIGELRLPPGLEAEIQILEPDPAVADLYRDVAAFNVLSAMLLSVHPQRWAKRILDELPRDEHGRVTLPREPDVLARLKETPWLLHRDGSTGLAPRMLIIVPGELASVLVPLGNAGALGQHHLTQDVEPAIWEAAEAAVHEILGAPDRATQVRHLAGTLNPAKIAEVDAGSYLVLPDPQRLTLSLIEDALASPLSTHHAGWQLLQAVTVAVDSGVKKQPHDIVLEIARHLCASVPLSRQVAILTAVSDTHPTKDSPSGRLFRHLMECFAEARGFTESVLPRIELPTQDGNWHPAREVARSASGIARRHRAVSSVREVLRIDADETVHAATGADVRMGARTIEALATYFEPWEHRVPSGAIGAFIAILDRGNAELTRLAERWLGADVNVEGIRFELVDACGNASGPLIKAWVCPDIVHGKRVTAINLLGQRVDMEADSDHDTIFAIEPSRHVDARGEYRYITLRDVAPTSNPTHRLLELLGGSVEWWAVRVLRLDRQKVQAWWERWGKTSQAQVGPVRRSILAHLPLTLDQLDVRDNPALHGALRDAKHSQRMREQAPTSDGAATKMERAALEELASLILKHQDFLCSRVQDRMRRFGYRCDSVLLELAQNADDALVQAAEIAGSQRSLPLEARRLSVHVHVESGATILDITHFGRPINDTGGAAFPEGRDRDWDQDLYYMMLLNLSGKPGEEAGEQTRAATTGRFGLGFKSVHLVSKSPEVVSGFVAFSIAGGLLPVELTVPDDADLRAPAGHRPTRVRLPLRSDVELSELFENRFAHMRTLLPVFARQLREIEVVGGPFAGISVFDGQVIEGAPGWSVARQPVDIAGHGPWHVLRFRPADTATGGRTGTAALAIGLKDGMPASLPHELPFLWNVAPTMENWGCGYAVNGPFKLNPGRTQVSLDDKATQCVVDLLGPELGRGLTQLHDAVLSSFPDSMQGVAVAGTPAAFLASLWRVLASGLNESDKLRRDFILQLHGSDRGLSAWMATRSVVPSGLPAPFPEYLPPLAPGARVEVAGPGLHDPEVCRALAEIPDTAHLAGTHMVVTEAVAALLRPLLNQKFPVLDASGLLAEVLERWDHELTPDRVHALRPLVQRNILKTVADGLASNTKLIARAAAGNLAPLRDMLLPRALAFDSGGADVNDELMLAAFAPSQKVLDPSYIAQPEDLRVFLRLRGRHQVDVQAIVSWYAKPAPEQRQAALRYLVRGKLQRELLQRLIPLEVRPDWLTGYEDVRQSLEAIEADRWRSQSLLAALFPDRFDGPPAPTGPRVLGDLAKRSFFQGFQEWWDDADVRHETIEGYERQAWPDWLRRDGIARGLKSDSNDHWLALLVLGACCSLGRAEASHHCGFLEWVRGQGWWEVFTQPDDDVGWMKVLRDWQDQAVAKLVYSSQMSLFPDIYQLSRYVEQYRRLLVSVARRPGELYRGVSCLLSPRIDEALTGAGQLFDAPPAPLNMGLHWVLRELVRLGILEGTHLFADCWVPVERVLRLLQPLGLEFPDAGVTNPEKARLISSFLARELKTEQPHLHLAFDIPLLHIDSSVELRERFGLDMR
jgi:hypothetical protein